MKKFLVLTVTLCMALLIFSSCGGKNKKPNSLKDALDNLPVELDDDTSKLLDDIATAQIPETKPTEAKIKISATLPEGWEEEKKETAIASYLKGASMIEVFESWKPSEVNDPKGVAEYEKEQIKEHYEGSVFYDIEEVKIAGLDGARLAIDLSFGSIKQRQTYIYFEKGGKYFKLMMAHFLDEDQKVIDEMESIIKSMKIE